MLHTLCCATHTHTLCCSTHTHSAAPCVFTQGAIFLFNRKPRCFRSKYIREAAAAEINDPQHEGEKPLTDQIHARQQSPRSKAGETEPASCYKTGPEVLMRGNLAHKGISSWSNNPSVIRINVNLPVNTLIITWRQ